MVAFNLLADCPAIYMTIQSASELTQLPSTSTVEMFKLENLIDNLNMTIEEQR
jgi:hypothetical protein